MDPTLKCTNNYRRSDFCVGMLKNVLQKLVVLRHELTFHDFYTLKVLSQKFLAVEFPRSFLEELLTNINMFLLVELNAVENDDAGSSSALKERRAEKILDVFDTLQSYDLDIAQSVVEKIRPLLQITSPGS
uniref:Uncharacterized protein n=1 Tax=Paramoeba aestuarina TaxID=180227 RepID=A0A7S4KN69_9EUKA|mmetsp:Transcript_22057/g.34276  ORF Transcript_22057/g.34276 Transcript_22057/m.34276 type:complete len:131 (+) Transcript_22057:1-393(+)